MMSMFAVPQGVIDELHALMARFWWGSTETKRKLHWWSWARLCQPKAVGGMGFRDLAVFNQALLAKQVWRLLTKPTTLLSTVLKARYFKHTTVLDARRGYDPSYAWRSLWAAKSLLLEGLKWRVGNGHNINVWSDSWLPGSSSHCVPKPNLNADPTMTVAEFIDPVSCEWRHDLLAQYLTEEEVRFVYELPLAEPLSEDQRFWWPTKDGVYTVKSGYRLGLNVVAPVAADDDGQADGVCWNVIWKLNAPPKLSHFTWKVLSNTLPVKYNLAQRHCCDDTSCDACGATIETIDHVMFDCPVAKDIWAASRFHSLVGSAPTGTSTFTWLLQRVGNAERADFLAHCWGIWYARNLRIFEDEQVPAQVVILGLIRMVEDYQSYSENANAAVRSILSGCESWNVPPVGFLKVNTDAALFDNGEVGLGAVGRDSTGRIVFVSSKRVLARWTSVVAELKAILYGITQSTCLGYHNVILESDSLQAVTAIKSGDVVRSPEGLVIDNILFSLRSLSSCLFSHVKRGGNTVAHYIARLCHGSGEALLYTDNFPQTVFDLAGFDLI